MPSETMNSRNFSSSLFSFEDVSPSTMKQDEFWKSDNLSNCYEKNKIDVISTQHESNLFSSSLSELFNSKLKLSANSVLYGHSVDNIAPESEEEMVFDSIEELEAQTIGNLLPIDDDDLLAGLTDDHEIFVKDSSGDESDEQDLFASVGGMDLGHDDSSSSGQKNSEFHDDACKAKLELYNTSIAREHPSRTLLVKNVASDVGDSELKALFEQFGGIQRVYNACKQCGFVLASYYDIRAAQNAMQAHRNGFFGFRTFDIQYLIPKDDPSMKEINQGTLAVSLYDLSITNNELRRMFRPFGEIKEIFETPQSPHHKLIEFYDVRAATAALEALNRNDTARKMLKVEPSLIGYSKRVSSSVPNGVLCNPSEFATNINIEKQERLDSNSRKFCQANYNAHPMELNDCVFESSTADGGLSLPRHRYKWSNSYQHVGMTWPNSPSYFDGVCAAPTLPRFHGVHRSPPHMISNVVSMNSHLAQSAPAANYNIWDRQHPYAGETHCLDFYPQNMFPSLGGNYVDLQVLPMDVGFPFHNHREMMFHGRHNMIPMINSFGTYKERARSRRQGRSTPVDTKQYELDIERIKNGEDNRTTLMIKNIPNKYTSKMLLAAIDECHKGAYDFVYLPIDFKNKCNMGYAFINMTNPSLIIPFYQEFNGKKWEKFNSEKVATLAYARIQGKAALIAHFQNSSLMNEDKRCRPILFNTDGPNAGDQIPFPVGENVRNKPVKLSPAAT
ncbi:protein MEI2-like 4 isoform X1 [Arachis ipaensis]|uniref:RRM domain-containing protein n=1 Tax=Arachis hypogaea TaxID=3818 RepID=A0A444WNE3_ARAHY|nr:protein MEI2-like 4 isoform X1 [Arachis ipaensis]XP_025650276.1 protein MEI2-like 4 isoform X1 [Arachis hypogaea]XP_025697001.1 protein MEI2-like 4 isoform X1 [Arachis hypogaea]QHO09587.1 Protein MEI2-like [Arachis hypogaea]QHO09588.1 Protein MEI2-like [Arachis hypogaea]RYQ79039.1 hypothetical protein Ahy_Scaffold8g108528 [Arachis hypogaea]